MKTDRIRAYEQTLLSMEAYLKKSRLITVGLSLITIAVAIYLWFGMDGKGNASLVFALIGVLFWMRSMLDAAKLRHIASIRLNNNAEPSPAATAESDSTSA